MKRGIKVVALMKIMMCMAVGAMISSCGDKGNSNKAVTRGAKVNPVVNSGRSAISRPVVKGEEEIELSPLVAKIDREMERVGAYRAASEAIMEGCVNRALNEGQDRIGMQEIDEREIEKALKQVEKMEEGRRKEVLKLFFQRAKSHCKGQTSFSVWAGLRDGSSNKFDPKIGLEHKVWNQRNWNWTEQRRAEIIQGRMERVRSQHEQVQSVQDAQQQPELAGQAVPAASASLALAQQQPEVEEEEEPEPEPEQQHQ